MDINRISPVSDPYTEPAQESALPPAKKKGLFKRIAAVAQRVFGKTSRVEDLFQAKRVVNPLYVDDEPVYEEIGGAAVHLYEKPVSVYEEPMPVYEEIDGADAHLYEKPMPIYAEIADRTYIDLLSDPAYESFRIYETIPDPVPALQPR